MRFSFALFISCGQVRQFPVRANFVMYGAQEKKIFKTGSALSDWICNVDFLMLKYIDFLTLITFFCSILQLARYLIN
jgi:hypothetical protein